MASKLQRNEVVLLVIRNSPRQSQGINLLLLKLSSVGTRWTNRAGMPIGVADRFFNIILRDVGICRSSRYLSDGIE